SLPTILAHAGIKGFSTQKLSAAWQPAPHVGGPDSPEKTPEGIPFNVGVWEGPDGSTVLAALNPLSYGSSVDYDVSKTPPPPPAAPVKVGDGPVHVTWSNADQMFLDILKCCKTDRMPGYKGDLELINHSAGSLTSQAYHKRWNRKNELLAAAAEESSVAADWL